MDRGAQTARLVRKVSGDDRVLAAILFGSMARGDARADSDVDVCLVAAQPTGAGRSLSRLQLEYAGEFDLDVTLFELLPLYVRRRVLSEGRLLFVRDEDRLYDVALRTAQEFEDYRPLYEAYLAEVARGGS